MFKLSEHPPPRGIAGNAEYRDKSAKLAKLILFGKPHGARVSGPISLAFRISAEGNCCFSQNSIDIRAAAAFTLIIATQAWEGPERENLDCSPMLSGMR